MFLIISTLSVPISTLSFNLVFPLFCGLLLWISMAFIFSGDKFKQIKTVVAFPHLDIVCCLFYSEFTSYRCFTSGYYHPNVRVSQNRTCFLKFFDDIGHNNIRYYSILVFLGSRNNFLPQLATYGSQLDELAISFRLFSTA
jgi:hypothetical protein